MSWSLPSRQAVVSEETYTSPILPLGRCIASASWLWGGLAQARWREWYGTLQSRDGGGEESGGWRG